MVQPTHVTINTCSMCQPLGAVLAFRGVRGAMPLLHGSQGCSTYMRLHLTRHFREPIDIASSALNEKQAIHGGGDSLQAAIMNIAQRYQPELIGLATTCLSEIIGDDVRRHVMELAAPKKLPPVVIVSTPSFAGSWSEGFKKAVLALIGDFAEGGRRQCGGVNLLPGFISPADSRYLQSLFNSCLAKAPIILPDNSDTLDSPLDLELPKLPRGGTPLFDIQKMGRASITIEFGEENDGDTAGLYLEREFGVKCRRLSLPIGLKATDDLMICLSELPGHGLPPGWEIERGRLLDAMADTHRVLYGKRALVFGSPDLVTALCRFLLELGMFPVLVATGEGGLGKQIRGLWGELSLSTPMPTVLEQASFDQIQQAATGSDIDIVLGDSNGRHIAALSDIPLLRLGFPIYDRFGAGRQRLLGYEAAIDLVFTLANMFVEGER